MRMREDAGISRSRFFAALLILTLVTAAGCAAGTHAGVRRALSRAGSPEPGTGANWVRGWKDGRPTSAEERMIKDPEGQWASKAEASSSFGEVSYRPGWTPSEATGAPDVPGMGVDGRAWGPLKENAGYEWIELTYAVKVHARAVRIREVHGTGCVVLVELREPDGRYHVKWKGEDRPKPYVSWLVLEFPETPYLVNGVKITLDTTAVAHWKLIDAVQLVGKP